MISETQNGWVKAATRGTAMALRIASITRKKGLQVRERLEQWKIEEYAGILDRLPPVDVVRCNGDLLLADGNHRIEAALLAGRSEITAIVTDGDENLAYEIAVRNNARAGLPLKTKEKKAAARGLVKRFPERSDNWIAEDCGLSKNTVEAIRAELVAGCQIDNLKERMGKDGKVYPAEMPPKQGLGQSADPAPQPPLEPEADAGPEPSAEPDEPQKPQQDKPLGGNEIVRVDMGDAGRLTYYPANTWQGRWQVGDVTIYQADARMLVDETLRNSIHLVVTSPPYNVGTEYSTHNDRQALMDYWDFLGQVFVNCYGMLVPGGRICVVTPFGVNRNPWMPFAVGVAETLDVQGFVMRGQIIWDKGTSGGRFTVGSFRLPTNPALRDTTECITVAYKEKPDLDVPPDVLRHDSEGTYSPFLEDQRYFLELAQDHWVVPSESAQRVGHPAPFPVNLVERLIHFYAFPGATILDPFAGSGTVGVAAIRNGCRAVLIDIDAGYCEIARKRCEDET